MPCARFGAAYVVLLRFVVVLIDREKAAQLLAEPRVA